MARAGLLLVWICLLVPILELRGVDSQIDDAYISYRYARNLIEGHGLVYNLGERVEGFTNLSWTLAIAAGLALGSSATSTAHWLGIASGCWLLWLGFRLAEALLPEKSRAAAAIAPWIVLSSRSFATWTSSGLETPLFAALATAALLAQLRGRLGLAAAAAAAATCTRPEGVLVAAVVFGAAWLPFSRSPRQLLATPRAWRPALGYALALALLTGFRLAYYGSPVPNTFYAKVGGIPLGEGLRYVAAFLRGGMGFLLPPALALVGSRRAAASPWLFLALWTAYVVSIGGDAFRHGRFLLPVVPVLAALGLAGWSRLRERAPDLAAALAGCIPGAVLWNLFGVDAALPVAAVFLLCAACAPSVRRALGRAWSAVVAASIAAILLASGIALPVLDTFERRERLRRYNPTKDVFVLAQVARVLDESPPVELVAHVSIGRFGFYSRLPMLDILGLIDPGVARAGDEESLPGVRLPGHQRSNAGYVLARRPDFIVIPPPWGPFADFQVPAVRALWADPRLEEQYVFDPKLRGFRRRDRVSGDAGDAP